VFDFEQAISKFQEIGGTAIVKILKDKPYGRWTDLFFLGKRYGEYSSNVAESFNSWILNERALPITACLDGIRVKVMEQMARRREESHLWNSTLCPSMEARLVELIEAGFRWDIYKSSNSVFEVKSPKSHYVDLKQQICSCKQWKIIEFPCMHAIKCMNRSKLSVYDYVEYYFTAGAYRCSYANAINPIPNFDKPAINCNDEAVIKPPKARCGVGRPSIKRKGGFLYFQNKQNRCGVCKKYGHNKPNCQASKKA